MDWAEAPLSETVKGVLDTFATPALAPGQIVASTADIATLTAGATDALVIAAIAGDGSDNPWRQKASKTLQAGSPTTAFLVPELQRRARSLTLADVFRLELTVAVQCAAHPDLPEGVRALLVDKDMQPAWTPADFAAVTPAWIAGHFAEPRWPTGRHPLADLGE